MWPFICKFNQLVLYEKHVSCVECSDQHPGHARTTLCLTTLLAKTPPYNFPGWQARLGNAGHARVCYVLPSLLPLCPE